MASPVGHHLGVVGGQGQRGVEPLGGDVVHPLLPVHQDVGQPAHLGPVRRRDAHQLGDHVHREQAGEVGDEVERAGLEGRAEVGDGQRPDALLHGRHPARREALADDGAHAGVPGRVHGEERHGAVGVGPEGGRVEGDAVGVRVVVHVAERREHVGMARIGEEVEVLVVEDRRLRPQAGVGRIGVLVDAVVVGAVSQRGHGRHGAVPVMSAVASPIRAGTASKRRWPMPALEEGARCRSPAAHRAPRRRRRRPGRPPGGARSRPRCGSARASRRDRPPATLSCRLARAGGPMDVNPMVRAVSATRSGRPRLRSTRCGVDCTRRHRTSARRWSLPEK